MTDPDHHKDNPDSIFEERFEKETRELLISRGRYLFVVGGCFYFAFWGLDWVSTPEYVWTFFFLRLFACVNYGIGLFLLYSRFKEKVALPLTIYEIYISVLCVVIMITKIGGFNSFYYIGIIFLFFVAPLFFPWKASETLICGVLSLTTYFALNMLLAYDDSVTWFEIARPMMFMTGAIGITTFANHGNHRNRRDNLRLRMQVEKANEELKELDKTKTRFFSNVSHELRSPLTLILGPLEILLSGKEEKNSRQLLEAMEANARRLLRQVNTLLDFAKIDAGKLQCKYSYGNLGKLLMQLAVAAGPSADKNNIALPLEAIKETPDSIMDSEKIETIAANLLSNAIKFTPEGGQISIRNGYDENIIWFEVEDTGAGIPKDQLETIFERFLQVEDSLSRRNEGTGLGLAMVRELTKMHGGNVTIKSMVGKGTIFHVELPRQPEMKPLERRRIIGRRRHDQLANERTLSMLGTTYEEKGSNKTLLADVAGAKLVGQVQEQIASPDALLVLVVDDNPDMRTFIARSLASEYQIEMAENGIEALKAARKRCPDLIISDIMMPKMDGYEFCRQIRKDPFLSKIPVILATSKGGGEAVVEGLAVGANDYLAKPFEIRELLARVQAQLRTRQLERNLNERESRLAAIGQMTSSIVHDLRNPLNAIMGFASIAKFDATTSQNTEMEKNLEPVIRESQRLSRMISEVLDYARGQITESELKPVELVSYLEQICSPLKSNLKIMGITLYLEHKLPEQFKIEIDTERLQRVIENLVRNAQEALCSGKNNPDGKSVWISTTIDSRSVIIEITDDGPGIDEKVIVTLFEPFATSGKKTGTGLGLATVRNLLKAQRGEISVKPKGDKGGAVFSMRFPLKENFVTSEKPNSDIDK